MKARIIVLLASLLCANAYAQNGYSASMAQSSGQNDTVYSTNQVGKPATNGGKVYSTTQVQPPDPVTDAVRKRFQLRFQDLKIGVVRPTPYGLFEVQLGGDMFYTDKDVSWVMKGPLIDAATRRDVTRENLEKLSAVSFSELPLDLAIKQVKGQGKHRIAIFEDPNCGYCKQLRHTLKEMDDVTIYTFLYPILSPDSTVKARDVLCAADPGKVLDAWMLEGKPPAPAHCRAPIEELVALGEKLRVRGTPTLFFEDNTRAAGVLPPAQLRERLTRNVSQ
ncbi:disulfide bond formation protein DsbC [Bordetella avium]|uniref:DsbC family protein n=1 Tax=Bordetella avium TaxID=521 RepID=UPI000FDB08DB|nr:DsbC family protein [Bordetella avium]AZY50556.1 disulfide bond formation protein DsbC [Bordetella avium]